MISYVLGPSVSSISLACRSYKTESIYLNSPETEVGQSATDDTGSICEKIHSQGRRKNDVR